MIGLCVCVPRRAAAPALLRFRSVPNPADVFGSLPEALASRDLRAPARWIQEPRHEQHDRHACHHERPRASRPAPASVTGSGATHSAGFQPTMDIGDHFGRQPIPLQPRRQGFCFRPEVAGQPKRNVSHLSVRALRHGLTCRPTRHRSESRRDPRRRTAPDRLFARMPHAFLPSRIRRNLIRAFAMCDRTVASEQFSSAGHLPAGKAVHVAQHERGPLALAQHTASRPCR